MPKKALKYKLRPQMHFSDNLEPSGHWKIRNPSTFCLDMPMGKSGFPERVQEQERKEENSN